MALHPVVDAVTNRIIERSRPSRSAYLAHLDAARLQGPQRGALSCTNLAHGSTGAWPASVNSTCSASRARNGAQWRDSSRGVGSVAKRA